MQKTARGEWLLIVIFFLALLVLAGLQIYWAFEEAQTTMAERLDAQQHTVDRYQSALQQQLVTQLLEIAEDTHSIADYQGDIDVFESNGEGSYFQRQAAGKRAPISQASWQMLTQHAKQERAIIWETGVWLRCDTNCVAMRFSKSWWQGRIFSPAMRQAFTQDLPHRLLQTTATARATAPAATLYRNPNFDTEQPQDASTYQFALNLQPHLMDPIPIQVLIGPRQAKSALPNFWPFPPLLLATIGTWLLLLFALTALVLKARKQSRLAKRQLLFVASTSHELRTPITVIRTAASNLASGSISSLDKAEQYGRLIEQQSQKLQALVDNVLQLSELQAKPPQLYPMDITQVVQEALDVCEVQHQVAEVKLRMDENLPQVLGEKSAILSLLINLITNALKYGNSDSWILVAVQRLILDKQQQSVAVSIVNPSDESADSDTEKWFTLFHRGESAYKQGIPGTGLGLAVARQIAQQHGGGLSLNVTPEGNVRATLYLPVNEP